MACDSIVLGRVIRPSEQLRKADGDILDSTRDHMLLRSRQKYFLVSWYASQRRLTSLLSFFRSSMMTCRSTRFFFLIGIEDLNAKFFRDISASRLGRHAVVRWLFMLLRLWHCPIVVQLSSQSSVSSSKLFLEYCGGHKLMIVLYCTGDALSESYNDLRDSSVRFRDLEKPTTGRTLHRYVFPHIFFERELRLQVVDIC